MGSSGDLTVTVRQSVPGDAKYLLEFTRAEGWDYTVYDYEAGMDIDPGFLLVAVDTSNTPVGFGSIAQCSPGTMYIDTFIVRGDLRRKGIGRQIWKALLERAGQNNVCVDSRFYLAEWYKKQGFIYESYTSYCYTADVTSELKSPSHTPYEATRFADNMWSALMEYDKKVYPEFNREKILRAWFKKATTVVALAEGNIVGYGCIHQKWKNNYGIRNVFGDNEVVAETILRYMCGSLPDEAVVHFTVVTEKPLPILDTNLNVCGTFKRLYAKAEIKINAEKMWIHSNTKI